MDTLLYALIILKKSPLSSCDKYLKSLSHKFLNNASRIELVLEVLD